VICVRFEVSAAVIIKIPSSAIWEHVGVVGIDAWEEHIASIFR
jgi:hypothetical protein